MSEKGVKIIEEKLSQALVYKDQGNELYKAKDYKKAMRKYHNAILYMKGIDNDLHGKPAFLQFASVDPNSDKKIPENLEDECIKANVSIYNNLAACILANNKDKNAVEDHEKVVKYTEIVLELEGTNDKALYRKGQALKSLKRFHEAKETFEFLLKLGKAPKDVANHIKDCNEALKEFKQKESSMYQNMFK